MLQDPWFEQLPKVKVNDKQLEEALSNLKKYNASQKFQQATLSLMVQNMISKEE